MTNYPAAIDGTSTLYAPADAFSTKPLETTATVAIGAGDSTISVVGTTGGFVDAYGILSIDDELIIYTTRSGSQFTGCQRGAFGTAAASHANGATVRANMVAGFITAVQSAVVAIETELGTAAARNYVRKDGAVTITGVKTFQDGAAFGTGNIAGTGLVRLPNLGAIKWRKADNSGDLGMALNASNHVAMDAVIDFAAGQTFGAFSYPDASTTDKGIVQIDSVGGLVVAAGVVGLASTAVTPGTYTKTTVDQKGRVTAGATLVAGDLPAHTHVAGDIVSGSLPLTIQKAGTAIGTRRALNLIEGVNVTLTVADDAGNDRVTVTVAGGWHSHAQPPLRDASRHRGCHADPRRPDRGGCDASLGETCWQYNDHEEVPASDRDRIGVRASCVGHASLRRPPDPQPCGVGRDQSDDGSHEPSGEGRRVGQLENGGHQLLGSTRWRGRNRDGLCAREWDERSKSECSSHATPNRTSPTSPPTLRARRQASTPTLNPT